MTGKVKMSSLSRSPSPVIPHSIPSRSHAQSDHFFSYDSRTNRTNISYKTIFYSYDCGPIPSYDFTHNAPRSPHDGSTKAPPWRRRASHPDTNHWLTPSPFVGPNRNTAASWLKAAVGPKSAPEIRHRCQGVAARYKIACSPACSPPLFRPWSDHGPNLAQSYSRNNRNTMRADT